MDKDCLPQLEHPRWAESQEVKDAATGKWLFLIADVMSWIDKCTVLVRSNKKEMTMSIRLDGTACDGMGRGGDVTNPVRVTRITAMATRVRSYFDSNRFGRRAHASVRPCMPFQAQLTRSMDKVRMPSGLICTKMDLQNAFWITHKLHKSAKMSRVWPSSIFRSGVLPFLACAPHHVAAGAFHTCVLLENGSVRCFGSNNHGQCSVPTELSTVADMPS